jgi:uncharacterized protein with LGFP repeats
LKHQDAYRLGRRDAWRIFSAVLTAAAIVAVVVFGAPQPANALSGSEFVPGLIISDQEFFNSNAMTQAQVQSFLEAREQGCTAADGQPCLKSYTTATTSKSAGSSCGAYQGAASEYASAIIWKVSQACGINPQVLLVLLEKEQSLVTDLAPSAAQYRSATGYACPDTAACDSAFYGLFNQIYKAAWQFKTYGLDPSSWRYHPGRVAIQYSPNAACGSSVVDIQNQATADLYNYTPYQPDAAALSNLHGVGDSCSSYGNRNFWVLYNTWFSLGPTMITEEYAAQGGASGPLGAPTSGILTVTQNGGGLGQAFAGGSIYWSPAGGVHTVFQNSIRQYWYSYSGEQGKYGWPTSNLFTETVNGGGLAQAFQNGSIFSTAAWGSIGVLDPVRNAYAILQGESGPLGWPTSESIALSAPSGATVQHFQGGDIFNAPGVGSHAVYNGAMAQAWLNTGGVTGSFGLPTTDPMSESVNGGGIGQAFQHGSVYSTARYGAFAVSGGIRDFYFSLNGERGALGWPTAAQLCDTSGACSQAFQGGVIAWSPATGGWLTTSAIEHAYASVGGAGGSFGLPTSGLLSESVNGGGIGQAFQHGSIYWTSRYGAFAVSGGIRDYYFSLNGERGSLGWPNGSQECDTSGMCAQSFEGGTVVWSQRTGGWLSTTAIEHAYVAAGGPAGAFGLPTTGPMSESVNGGGVGQAFEHGSIYSTTRYGAFAVSGAIRDYYFSLNGERGALGWPTGAASCNTSGYCSQSFQGGTIASHQGSSGWLTTPDIEKVYESLGGPAGSFGATTTAPMSETVNGGGVGQAFQHGSIYWTARYGAFAVSGGLRNYYFSLNGERGSLGWPTGTQQCTTGGMCTQSFQGGSIYWSPAAGGSVH